MHFTQSVQMVPISHSNQYKNILQKFTGIGVKA